jgi:hypothetical protein
MNSICLVLYYKGIKISIKLEKKNSYLEQMRRRQAQEEALALRKKQQDLIEKQKVRIHGLFRI